MLNVAHFAVTTDLNGPGKRFTLWLQGCPLGCKGCFNPELAELREANLLPPEEIASKVPVEEVRGVTLSGGEPFMQAAELSKLLDLIAAKNPAIEIIVFTGYRLDETRRVKGGQGLLSRIDLLIDGRFDENRQIKEGWRGSSNQELIGLTKRGEALKAEMERVGAPEFGVTISHAGEVIISGFPPPERVKALRKKLGD